MFVENSLWWRPLITGAERGFEDLTFNPDGTITVEGGTEYGEVWTAVLTKQ
jgi:hypothetical protein